MKKWIPVSPEGQLWRYESNVRDGMRYPNIVTRGYAVVLNNKPFTLISTFPNSRCEMEYKGDEAIGSREIIYLV